MKTLTILILISLASACSAGQMLGRIPIASPDDVAILSSLGFEIYNDELKGVVDVIFEEEDLGLLQRLGYEVGDLIPLADLPLDRIDPEYHTYEELTSELQALTAQYPNLCRLDSIGRATQFPRTMWSVKLSDNAPVEEDEISLFYLGTHHANEVMGCETLLYMINHFLENYGVDPLITQWMNDYEIFFVPLVNPDGHYAVTSEINLFWRKNARDINNNNIYYEFYGGTWWTDDHEGIDLNRNYNWFWELGGSSNMWAYNYRGAAPFSESEMQAIKYLAAQQRFACGISFHSYGEVVIAPWTYLGQPAPDQDVLNSIAEGLANSFIADNGGPYDWYTQNGREGRCPNWFYGYVGALTYDIELNPYPVFIPPGNQLAERTQRYMNGAVYLLERLSGPGVTGHVTDAVTGNPLPARVEIQGRISPQVKPRFAEPLHGRFTRLLNNGTYTVLSGMQGYRSQRIQNVVVNDTLTVLEIQLQPLVQEVSQTTALSQLVGADFQVVRNIDGQIEFRLNLNEPSNVSLKIYNLQGRQVATLLEREMGTGNHSFSYNAAGLPSGIYFARLSGMGFSKVQKIILTK